MPGAHPAGGGFPGTEPAALITASDEGIDESMPRANRRRPGPRLEATALGAMTTSTETYAGRAWTVRRIRGSQGGRSYLCPGCNHLLDGPLAHVVVWPADGVGGVEDRRHWHTRCWTRLASPAD